MSVRMQSAREVRVGAHAEYVAETLVWPVLS